MTKPTYLAILKEARSWKGYLEKATGSLYYLKSKTANAGYSNYTWFNYTLHKLQPSNMDYPAPWCCAFVSYLFYKVCGLKDAKTALCGDIEDYTVQAADYYQDAGRWGQRPRIGAQVFFANSSGICHTGIVYAYGDTVVKTIEGNTSSADGVVDNGGGVFLKSYALNNSRIAGYGYPKYATEPLKTGTHTTLKDLTLRADSTTGSKKLGKVSKGTKVDFTALRVNQYGNLWGYSDDLGGWLLMEKADGRRVS